jgi:glycosyltransferase involved in cell wall biosynthesis
VLQAPGLPERPLTSVVLCTWQGERHLEEQLASLVAQTRHPDELVVVDDCSTDRTPAILRAFEQRSPFRVRIQMNEIRLGWVRNFEKALGLAEGDVIFFADQDDVWDPPKIARLLEALRGAPKAGLAFSDGRLVDENLRPLGLGIWESMRFQESERRSIEADGGFDHLIRQFRHVPAPGMTIAFRSTFRELLLPFPPGWWHDAWVPVALAAVGAGPVMVAEPLVRWRQHAGQATGLAVIRDMQRKRRMMLRGRAHETKVELCRGLLRRLCDEQSRFAPEPRALTSLRERLRHSEVRVEIRKRRWKLAPVWQELRSGNYHKYSRGWWSAASDLLR